MIFDFATLPPLQRHKLLTASVVPRPIAWVSTLSPDGVANAAPFAFFNIFGDDPPVLALGIHNGANGPNDTGRNIRATGEFVVNLVPVAALELMEVTAFNFAPEIDEFAVAGLTSLPSQFVQPPRIGESPVALECRLVQEVPLGPSRWLAIGQVLGMHVADWAVRDAERAYIDTEKLDLVARMQGGTYARIGAKLPQPRGHQPTAAALGK